MWGVGGKGRTPTADAEEGEKVPEETDPKRTCESSEGSSAEAADGATRTWKSARMDPSWFCTRHE